MADRTFRVGVIGLGFGAAVHIPAFQAMEGVEVVACAGRRPDKSAEVAARFGIAHGCESAERLLDLDLDAVSLALPPEISAAVAAKAIERGLAVLSEKPLAASLSQAEDLCRLARNTVTAVNFQFGELAPLRDLHDLAASRHFGEIRTVTVDWQVSSWAQTHGKWSWKTDAAQGGGVMTMMGAHFLYLAEWLAGPADTLAARFVSQRTASFAPPGAEPAEEEAMLEMRGPSNVTVLARIGNASIDPPLHRWRIECENGTLVLENRTASYMDGFTLDLLPAHGDATRREFPAATGGDGGRLDAFASLARRFVDSARRGQPMQPGFTEGLRVQRLMDATRLAARNGGWIRV